MESYNLLQKKEQYKEIEWENKIKKLEEALKVKGKQLIDHFK